MSQPRVEDNTQRIRDFLLMRYINLRLLTYLRTQPSPGQPSMQAKIDRVQDKDGQMRAGGL